MRWPHVFVLVGCLLFASGCSVAPEAQSAATKDPGNSPLLAVFEKQWPESRAIVTQAGDVTGDGIEDLIVIFSKDDEHNGMLVVVGGEAPLLTNDIPAPAENQSITLRDIDEKAPMEFIVQGSKGAKVGYAIYRVEGDRLSDLFGEGMEDCC